MQSECNGTRSSSKEYVQSDTNGLSVAKVLNAISDDKSWSLFTTIAISSDPTSNVHEPGKGGRILISCTNLTSRQYYQRIGRLRSLGLVYRKKGKYTLSSLGRVVHETQKTVEIAIQNRWRLVALDSLEPLLGPDRIPVEVRIKITNILLEGHDEIKTILLSTKGSSSL